MLEQQDLQKERMRKMEGLPIIFRDRPTPKLSEKQEKYLREFATFEFTNIEDSGMAQVFSYGNPQNKMTFKFFDGGKYRIPRHVARHVDTAAVPKWAYEANGSGQMIPKKASMKSRFQMREVFEV